MDLISYRAATPHNLYRFYSLGGHSNDEVSEAFIPVFADAHETVGLILDLKDGLPLFPKEKVILFARKGEEIGIKKSALAVIAHPAELVELKARYDQYPALVEDHIQLEVEVFASEAEATRWVLERI